MYPCVLGVYQMRYAFGLADKIRRRHVFVRAVCSPRRINYRLNDVGGELIIGDNIAWENGPEKGVLTGLIEVCYGEDHKKLADGAYPVYGSGGLMRHVEKFEKYLHEGEAVLIPRKGALNNVMLVNGRFWTVDTMFYTKELMEGTARYAYFILSKMVLHP